MQTTYQNNSIQQAQIIQFPCPPTEAEIDQAHAAQLREIAFLLYERSAAQSPAILLQFPPVPPRLNAAKPAGRRRSGRKAANVLTFPVPESDLSLAKRIDAIAALWRERRTEMESHALRHPAKMLTFFPRREASV